MEGPDPTWPGQATLGLGLYSKEKGKPLRVAICVDTLGTLDTVWKMDWGGEPPIDAGFHQEAVALNQKELAQVNNGSGSGRQNLVQFIHSLQLYLMRFTSF